MSLENVKNFEKVIKKNIELDRKLGNILAQVIPEQIPGKIIEFAKKHGFEFTEADLRSCYPHNTSSPQENTQEENIAEQVFSSSPPFSTVSSNQDSEPHTFSPSATILLNQNSEIQELETKAVEKSERIIIQLGVKLDSFFFWLSGTNPETLARCPSSEQMKHAALGMSVLIPIFSATISSMFILYKLNSPIYFMIPISILWALIILIMDRSLLATYRAYLPLRRKINQIIFRFLIALLMGLTIAHPLNLMLFHVEIDSEIQSKKREDIMKIEHERKELDDQKFQGKNFRARLDEVEQRIQKITSRQPSICQSDFLNMSKKQEMNEILMTLQKDRKQLEQERDEQRNNLQKWGQLIEAERAGRIYSTTINEKYYETSGKNKCGQQCKAYEKSKQMEEASIEKTEKKLSVINDRIIKETERIYKEKEAQAKILTSQVVQNQQRCLEARKLDEAQRSIDRQIAQSEQENVLSEQSVHQEKLDEVNARGSDILTQTEALHNLIKRSEASWYLLANYIGWAILFFLIDTLPIVLKIFSVGTYDRLIHAREAVYDENYIKQYTESAQSVQLEKERLHVALEKSNSRNKVLRDFLNKIKQLDSEFSAEEENERNRTTHLKESFSKRLKEEVLNEKIKFYYQYKLTMMKEFFTHITSKQ